MTIGPHALCFSNPRPLRLLFDSDGSLWLTNDDYAETGLLLVEPGSKKHDTLLQGIECLLSCVRDLRIEIERRDL